MEDYIIYRDELEGLWNGNLYIDKEGRQFSLYYVNPSSVTLMCNDGYNDDNLFFNSITITLKLNAFKEFIANGDLQLIGSSLYDPWVREGDTLVINGKKHYVEDVISISDSIMIDYNCYDFWDLDIIINNSPCLLKEYLLEERAEHESKE